MPPLPVKCRSSLLLFDIAVTFYEVIEEPREGSRYEQELELTDLGCSIYCRLKEDRVGLRADYKDGFTSVTFTEFDLFFTAYINRFIGDIVRSHSELRNYVCPRAPVSIFFSNGTSATGNIAMTSIEIK